MLQIGEGNAQVWLDGMAVAATYDRNFRINVPSFGKKTFSLVSTVRYIENPSTNARLHTLSALRTTGTIFRVP